MAEGEKLQGTEYWSSQWVKNFPLKKKRRKKNRRKKRFNNSHGLDRRDNDSCSAPSEKGMEDLSLDTDPSRFFVGTYTWVRNQSKAAHFRLFQKTGGGFFLLRLHLEKPSEKWRKIDHKFVPNGHQGAQTTCWFRRGPFSGKWCCRPVHVSSSFAARNIDHPRGRFFCHYPVVWSSAIRTSNSDRRDGP